MRLSTVKDKVLKHIVNSKSTYDLSSFRIKHDLKLDHFMVIAALLELQESKFISLTDVSTTGTGYMRAYMVRTIDAPAYYFAKTRSFRKRAIENYIKEIIKSYWVVIAFIIPIAGNIYQIFESGKQQSQMQLLQKQLNNIRDSLYNSKISAPYHKIESK